MTEFPHKPFASLQKRLIQKNVADELLRKQKPPSLTFTSPLMFRLSLKLITL